MRGEIFLTLGPALHGNDTPCYELVVEPTSVGNAALMIAASAKKAYRQIDPQHKAGTQPWMRVPPGGHLLAWVFGEFKKLYGSENLGELAMRHSLAGFMHNSELVWWPFNSMRAWTRRAHTLLLEISDHGNMRTRGPPTPMEDRCVPSVKLCSTAHT